MSSRAVTDVSLLLDLSEEVLVHIIKLGRFTLTDVGHLRASCKRVCGFLDRIRDTVLNEHVVGNLSKYVGYWSWTFDRAAANGHLEVIKLLHEDEVKRGRVGIRCTDEVIRCAIKLGDWNMFVFLVRNRTELSVSQKGFYVPSHEGEYPWTNLSDEQVQFLLCEAPSFLVGLAAMDAIKGPISRGNSHLVAKLLLYVNDHFILSALIDAFLRICESPAVFEVVLAECRKRKRKERELAMAVLFKAVAQRCDGAVLLNMALQHFSLSLANLNAKERKSLTIDVPDVAVMSRLREFGLKRTVVNQWTEDLVFSVETEGATIDKVKALVSCLLREDYVAAEFVANRCRADWTSVSRDIVEKGSLDAIKWLHARGRLDTTPDFLLGRHTLTPERVDFVWPLAQTGIPHDDGDTVARLVTTQWFDVAIERGNVAMLRYLCEHLDVVGLHSNEHGTHSTNFAAATGSINVISYLIDVNSRIALVADSLAARKANAFDLQRRPFDLSWTLETAVSNGQIRLAELLVRRVPGLRLSLGTACASRRWSLFRWTLARLEATERTKALEDALLGAVRRGHIDFVNWFEDNEPDVFQRCHPKFWETMLYGHVTQFWYLFLSKHPLCVSTKLCTSENLYDILTLERRLGIAIMVRPLGVLSRDRSALQLFIDFAVPVIPPTPQQFDRLRVNNPSLCEWLTDCFAMGKFVVSTTTVKE